MGNRPKVGLGVCIIHNDKVLFGKRKNAHGEGDWCWPGGHLEFGESREECAKRETKEEANIDITDIQLMHVTNDVFVQEQKHYITLLMKATYIGGEVEVMEPDKMIDRSWFARDDLPANIFLPIKNLKQEGVSPFDT